VTLSLLPTPSGSGLPTHTLNHTHACTHTHRLALTIATTEQHRETTCQQRVGRREIDGEMEKEGRVEIEIEEE